MNQAVRKTTSQNVQQSSQQSGEVQQPTRSEVFLRPPVDIYEDNQALTVKADLPVQGRAQHPRAGLCPSRRRSDSSCRMK